MSIYDNMFRDKKAILIRKTRLFQGIPFIRMPLTEAEKNFLLKTARETIESHIKGVDDPEPDPPAGGLTEERGAFVTLQKGGELRGCIGTFSSDKPLYKTVEEMAVSAATKDPRFAPVIPVEVDALEIEISALTPLREISDISEIEIGRHGIYIIEGMYSGVLLPQVATEHNFDRISFLEHTCLKAGLPKNCWKQGARILVFEAEVFREVS
jgi:AmmeMemoRadiSam system protein A